MELDPAVANLLALDPARTTVSYAGGGGCSSASTARISTTQDDGREQRYFLKSGSGKEAEVMFRGASAIPLDSRARTMWAEKSAELKVGEHASLNALHDAVPSLCPRSYGWGHYSSSASTYFLATEFLDMSSRSSRTVEGRSISKSLLPMSLAAKLAKLHNTPAPTPEGYSSPMFGFDVTTCCGDTPQDNSFKSSWAEFFADNRLRFILAQSEYNNGVDGELKKMVEATASQVVPRLLDDAHLNGGQGVVPVVVHGDLWTGNASRGIIGADTGPVQDVVYDPSACYAHSEYDLGIMKMFGGFGGSFWDEYHGICPKTEPVEEYSDRIALYELYHHLNHHALFGGGYRSGAMSIMKKLLHKYSGGEGN